MISGVPVALTERVTHTLYDTQFINRLNSLMKTTKRTNVLVMSGLPPFPIKQSSYEAWLYQKEDKISSETYSNLYDLLKEYNFICIGGDLHIGIEGSVIDRETERAIGKVYVSGPSSGFCSAYMDKSCIGDLERYRFDIQQFREKDANCVYVNLKTFESQLIYQEGSFRDFVYNLGSTMYHFWG